MTVWELPCLSAAVPNVGCLPAYANATRVPGIGHNPAVNAFWTISLAGRANRTPCRVKGTTTAASGPQALPPGPTGAARPV